MAMEEETNSVVGAQSDGVRLAELITAWAKPLPSGKSLMEFRSSERKTSWWKVHGEAVLLMLSVDKQVDATQDPRLQKSWNLIEPRLWSGIYATEHGLGSGSQVSFFTTDTLAILDAVVSRLESEQKPLLTTGPEFQALRMICWGFGRIPSSLVCPTRRGSTCFTSSPGSRRPSPKLRSPALLMFLHWSTNSSGL